MYEMCKSEPWFAGYFPLIWENFLREKCQKCAYRGFTYSNAGKISAVIQYCGKKVESLSIAELFPYLYFSIFLAFFWMKSQPNLFSMVVNQWECSVHTHQTSKPSCIKKGSQSGQVTVFNQLHSQQISFMSSAQNCHTLNCSLALGFGVFFPPSMCFPTWEIPCCLVDVKQLINWRILHPIMWKK